jgi:hypothetical protein
MVLCLSRFLCAGQVFCVSVKVSVCRNCKCTLRNCRRVVCTGSVVVTTTSRYSICHSTASITVLHLQRNHTFHIPITIHVLSSKNKSPNTATISPPPKKKISLYNFPKPQNHAKHINTPYQKEYYYAYPCGTAPQISASLSGCGTNYRLILETCLHVTGAHDRHQRRNGRDAKRSSPPKG